MLKKSLIYIFLVYSIQVLSIILNILFIRNLSLENLGQLTLAKIYFQFMDYLHLGSRFSMDRYIPSSDTKNATILTNVTLYISTFMSIVTIFVVYFFINDNWIVLAFMISGFIFAQGTIYKAYFRAKEKTGNMIKVVLITMLFPLVVQLIVISFFDFDAYVIMFLLSYTTAFLYLNYKYKLFTFIDIKKIINKFKEVFKTSSILFFISLIGFVSFSIDKVLLEKYMGSEILGEYSIILFVFATLLIIPGSLAELVFPKIIKKVTNTAQIFFWKEIFFVAFPTLVAIIGANLVMDFFINLFTDYSYLLPYLHMVTWAVLPYAISSILYHVLNASDRRKKILGINLFALVIYSLYIVYIIYYFENDVLYWLVLGRIIYACIIVLAYLFTVRGLKTHV